MSALHVRFSTIYRGADQVAVLFYLVSLIQIVVTFAAAMAAPGTVLLFAPAVHSHLIPYIAAIHAACITHDRTLATFLPPLSHEKLLSWWKERIAEVNDGSRLIFIIVSEAEDTGRIRGPEVMGVVMLYMPFSETGAFRGSVEKLLVHKNFRGKGAATALMASLEVEAAQRGRTTLVRFPRGSELVRETDGT